VDHSSFSRTSSAIADASVSSVERSNTEVTELLRGLCVEVESTESTETVVFDGVVRR